MRWISLMVIALFLQCPAWSQASLPQIEAVIPTVQQEASYIWRTIHDILFFEQLGYNVSLPKDTLIDALILKSKNGTFGNDDFSAIYNLLESKIYDENNYKQALEKVEEQQALVNKVIYQLDSLSCCMDWTFKMPERYEVLFTLYGSGGSYSPETGTITLFTTSDGRFKNYKNPANTIVHEIVHIGMEDSIIQPYNIPHVTKEQMVDQFVYLMFAHLLPNYKIQQFDSVEIDHPIRNKADLKKLGALLEDYKK